MAIRVQLDHLAPTAVGGKAKAEATLEKVEGRRLFVAVSVSDDRGLIAAGKVTRVVVNVERFLDKAAEYHRESRVDGSGFRGTLAA